MRIVLLDYGMGNLRSVQKAIQFLGAEASIQQNLAGAEKLIIPGVGAFGAAMDRLRPLVHEVRALASGGAPLLGICLGMQLFLERSEEHGDHAGLGIIGGQVRHLPSNGLKIPQVGWNEAAFRPNSRLGAGMEASDQVYFVHSLFTDCADEADVAATTDYGISFPSAIERGNIWGTQFHPEKSGRVGLRLLRNFLRL